MTSFRFHASARPLPALLLISCALLLGACGKAGGDAKAAAAPPPMPVTAITVATRPVPVSIDAVGQAEGSREVEIRARVNGILERRTFEEGTAVPPGTELFVIDPAIGAIQVTDDEGAKPEAVWISDGEIAYRLVIDDERNGQIFRVDAPAAG